MLAIERKNEILQKLRADQRVLVSELAAHYQVTEETIRRDLRQARKRRAMPQRPTAAPSSATAPKPTSPTPSAARPTSSSRTRSRTLSVRW
ncbi:MAG: DeoR family transcriptional regulator [Oscillospiraceae bacterium]